MIACMTMSAPVVQASSKPPLAKAAYDNTCCCVTTVGSSGAIFTIAPRGGLSQNLVMGITCNRNTGCSSGSGPGRHNPWRSRV